MQSSLEKRLRSIVLIENYHGLLTTSIFFLFINCSSEVCKQQVLLLNQDMLPIMVNAEQCASPREESYFFLFISSTRTRKLQLFNQCALAFLAINHTGVIEIFFSFLIENYPPGVWFETNNY